LLRAGRGRGLPQQADEPPRRGPRLRPPDLPQQANPAQTPDPIQQRRPGPLLAGFIVDGASGYWWGIAFALVAGMPGFAAVVPLRIPRTDPQPHHRTRQT
jgi:hypothetical protein